MPEGTEYPNSVDLHRPAPPSDQVNTPPTGGNRPSALGLVNLETSDTPPPDTVTTFSLDYRLRRMKDSVIWTANLIQEQVQGMGFKPAMVTATYRPDQDWNKRHVSQLVKHIRHYLNRRGYPALYVWVIELQKNGRPHYHILIWLPKGITLPKPDKRGWWPYGSTRIEWARRPVGYLVKYASKGKDFHAPLPKHARLHGTGGLDFYRRLRLAWRKLPSYIRELWGSDHRPTRAPGGGFLSRITGEVEPSHWQVTEHTPGWEQVTFRLKPEYRTA